MPAGQITNFHAGYVNAGLLAFPGHIRPRSTTPSICRRTWEAVQGRLQLPRNTQLLSQVGSASPNEYAGQLGIATGETGVPKSKGTRRSADT